MKFVVTSNAGIIASQQKHLDGMRGSFDAFAHIQAQSVLLHAVEHSDVMPMRKLTASMGHAKGAMNKWLTSFGPCSWGKLEDKGSGIIFDKAKFDALVARKAADPKAFDEWLNGLPRFDKLTPPKDELPAFNLMAEIKRLYAKAERIAKDETRKAKADLTGIEKLKALVPAG